MNSFLFKAKHALKSLDKGLNNTIAIPEVVFRGRFAGCRLVGDGPHDDGRAVLVALVHFTHHRLVVGQRRRTEVVVAGAKRTQ